MKKIIIETSPKSTVGQSSRLAPKAKAQPKAKTRPGKLNRQNVQGASHGSDSVGEGLSVRSEYDVNVTQNDLELAGECLDDVLDSTIRSENPLAGEFDFDTAIQVKSRLERGSKSGQRAE